MCQSPVPELSTVTASARPASARATRRTVSAIGDRQMFPRQTRQTRYGVPGSRGGGSGAASGAGDQDRGDGGTMTPGCRSERAEGAWRGLRSEERATRARRRRRPEQQGGAVKGAGEVGGAPEASGKTQRGLLGGAGAVRQDGFGGAHPDLEAVRAEPGVEPFGHPAPDAL